MDIPKSTPVNMKTSLEHLPERHRHELQRIAQEIAENVPACEKIILFGSYARGGFVEYDERVEFGTHTTFQSDYDIMVILNSLKDVRRSKNILRDIERRLHQITGFHSTPPSIVDEKMSWVNQRLKDAHYFYREIVEEGILLYDAGNIPFVKIGAPRGKYYQKLAQEFYDEKMHYVESFHKMMNMMYQENEKRSFRVASFLLHQMAEHLYTMVTLIYTLRRPKSHELEKYRGWTKSFIPELLTVFPETTAEEKHLFNLLCRAYIEGRYNPHFWVTKEELDAMISRVLRLRDIIVSTCTEKINSITAKDFPAPLAEEKV